MLESFWPFVPLRQVPWHVEVKRSIPTSIIECSSDPMRAASVKDKVTSLAMPETTSTQFPTIQNLTERQPLCAWQTFSFSIAALLCGSAQ